MNIEINPRLYGPEQALTSGAYWGLWSNFGSNT